MIVPQGSVYAPLDLAFVADALLGLCAADPLAPFATEATWSKRDARRSLREGPFVESPSADLAAKVQDELLARQVREVVDGAGLTRAQAEAFSLRMQGLTFEEIGAVRRTSKQASMDAFSNALRKVAASLASYPYDGLDEAYAADVARRGRRVAR